MKKKIFKIILSSFFILLGTTSHSQENVSILNDLLEKQEYNQFEIKLNELYKDEQSKNQYLFSKVYSGHNIVYWILANEYSKKAVTSKYVFDNIDHINFTKQMLYTALILTEQDSHSCVQNIAKNATLERFKKYRFTVDFERKFLQNNLQNFDKSTNLVEQLKNRPKPNWACFEFGHADDAENQITAYGKILSGQEIVVVRRNILSKLRDTILRK